MLAGVEREVQAKTLQLPLPVEPIVPFNALRSAHIKARLCRHQINQGLSMQVGIKHDHARSVSCAFFTELSICATYCKIIT